MRMANYPKQEFKRKMRVPRVQDIRYLSLRLSHMVNAWPAEADRYPPYSSGPAYWKYFRGCGCIGWTGMPAWICGGSGIYIYFLWYADKKIRVSGKRMF